MLLAAVIDLKRITILHLCWRHPRHRPALLLPLIVMPGPGSMIAPKGTPVAGELDAEADPDQTAARPPPARPVEDKAPPQAAPEPAAPGRKPMPSPIVPRPWPMPVRRRRRRSPSLRRLGPKARPSPPLTTRAEEYGRATEHQARRSPLGQQGHQDRPVCRRHQRAVYAGRAIQAEIAEKNSKRRCCAPP